MTRAKELRFTPTREYCIDAIERFGVDAVYPGKKLTKEQAIQLIRNTPDKKWYPADDVFWQRKEEP